jgi:hypothetical protein
MPEWCESMDKIVEREFEVDDFVDDLVWIELLDGPKKGFQFAVPVCHDAYASELRERVSKLKRGDRIVARLRSENERDTAWRFVDVSKRAGESERTSTSAVN